MFSLQYDSLARGVTRGTVLLEENYKKGVVPYPDTDNSGL